MAASMLLSDRSARAQEALRSALSVDRTIAPPVESTVGLGADRSFLGPVQLAVGVYAKVSYDDNVYLSGKGQVSDLLLGGGVNLGFQWPATQQSEIRFGTGIGYLSYLKNSRVGGLEINPDSALTYRLTLGDTSATLFDQFDYSRQVVTVGALANLATLPRLENTAGIRVAWNPGQWKLQVGYSHDSFFSDNSAYQYLNRSSEYLFARTGWLFADATEAGLEASGDLATYQFTTQNNNRSASLGVYVDWQVRSSLRLTLRGGPAISLFDSQGQSQGGSTLSSYYAGIEAAHQVTDFFSHRLSISRDVQSGVNQGSAYVEQLTASYSLSWALTQWITIRASLTYENGTQPFANLLPGGFVLATSERFRRYGGGPKIAWQATDKLSASVSYNHWERTSNLAGRNYRDNSVSLNMNYGF